MSIWTFWKQSDKLLLKKHEQFYEDVTLSMSLLLQNMKILSRVGQFVFSVIDWNLSLLLFWKSRIKNVAVLSLFCVKFLDKKGFFFSFSKKN